MEEGGRVRVRVSAISLFALIAVSDWLRAACTRITLERQELCRLAHRVQIEAAKLSVSNDGRQWNPHGTNKN